VLAQLIAPTVSENGSMVSELNGKVRRTLLPLLNPSRAGL
jgi:hypothetical protein